MELANVVREFLDEPEKHSQKGGMEAGRERSAEVLASSRHGFEIQVEALRSKRQERLNAIGDGVKPVDLSSLSDLAKMDFKPHKRCTRSLAKYAVRTSVS